MVTRKENQTTPYVHQYIALEKLYLNFEQYMWKLQDKDKNDEFKRCFVFWYSLPFF